MKNRLEHIREQVKNEKKVTVSELSKIYKVTEETIRRDLEKLEKEGIISSYTVNIDLKKVGFPIIAFVKLDLDPKLKPEFYPYIKAHPNVLECSCVTGQYSQLIKVAFATTEDLDLFVGDLNNYGHTETQIAFSTPQPPRGIGIEKIAEVSK